ncbi:MAG: hypothetical protein ABFS45_01500 [Pseudomonadota bacterium]
MNKIILSVFVVTFVMVVVYTSHHFYGPLAANNSDVKSEEIIHPQSSTEINYKPELINNIETTVIGKEIKHLHDALTGLQRKVATLENKQAEPSEFNLDMLHEDSIDLINTTLSDMYDEDYTSQHDTDLSSIYGSESLAIRFSEEEYDSDWSPQAERLIETEYYKTAEAMGIDQSVMLRASCKKRLCRIELGFNDGISSEEIITNIPMMMPWDAQGVVHINEGESTSLIVYLAREGYEL